MKFETPPPARVAFEIPDDWWIFAEMDRFSRGDDTTYMHEAADGLQIVSIDEIEPPTRSTGVPLLKKHRLASLLLAFSSPDVPPLPPVQVRRKPGNQPYRFSVYDGCHRYYASVAAGFLELPVFVLSEER